MAAAKSQTGRTDLRHGGRGLGDPSQHRALPCQRGVRCRPRSLQGHARSVDRGHDRARRFHLLQHRSRHSAHSQRQGGSPLAVTTPKRSPALPDVPTSLEAGYANSDYTFWLGVFVPAKTPRDIVDRLHQTGVQKVLGAAGHGTNGSPQKRHRPDADHARRHWRRADARQAACAENIAAGEIAAGHQGCSDAGAAPASVRGATADHEVVVGEFADLPPEILVIAKASISRRSS